MASKDTWLSDYEACTDLSQKIMEKLNERSKEATTTTTYSRLTSSARSMMQTLHNDVNKLKQILIRASASYHLTQREIDKREGMLDTLLSRQKLIEQTFNNEKGAGRVAASVWQPATTNEEDVTDLSISQIRQRQQHMIEQQDDGIEALSSIIQRQKAIGLTIGREVDEQNEIIDDIGDHVERTNTRLVRETQHIRIIQRKSSSCVMWIVIVILFIAIIVVVAVPRPSK